MSKDLEGMNWFVPKVGQIVRLKAGSEKELGQMHMGRAAEEGGPPLNLREGKVYRVEEYRHDEHHRSITVREIKSFVHVAGEKHAVPDGHTSIPLAVHFFEPSPEHNK